MVWKLHDARKHEMETEEINTGVNLQWAQVKTDCTCIQIIMQTNHNKTISHAFVTPVAN